MDFNTMDAFYCRKCKMAFSMDPDSVLAPVHISCGHCICVECVRTIQKNADEDSDCPWFYSCPVCESKFAKLTPRTSPSLQNLIKEVTLKIAENRNNVAGLSACLKLSAFKCSRCAKPFSTHLTDPHVPIHSFCGHYECFDCWKKFSELGPTGRFCLKCKTCETTSSLFMFKIAEGFLEIMTDMTDKIYDYLYGKKEYMNCFGCSRSIVAAKALICTKCSDISKDLSALCFECVFREHRSTDHVMIDYYLVKNKKESIDAKEASDLTISGYKTLINDINDSHMAEIGKIKEIVQVVCDRMQELPSVEECLDTLNKLKVEMHMFKEAIDILIPVAKSVNNTLKEINSNIGRILPTEK